MQKPAKNTKGTKEYFLNGFRLAYLREGLGGANAIDSGMFKESVMGLKNLGWDKDKIISAIRNEVNIICGECEGA